MTTNGMKPRSASHDGPSSASARRRAPAPFPATGSAAPQHAVGSHDHDDALTAAGTCNGKGRERRHRVRAPFNALVAPAPLLRGVLERGSPRTVRHALFEPPPMNDAETAAVSETRRLRVDQSSTVDSCRRPVATVSG